MQLFAVLCCVIFTVKNLNVLVTGNVTSSFRQGPVVVLECSCQVPAYNWLH
jgi:hypothetical protein